MTGVGFKTDREKHEFSLIDLMLKVVIISLGLYVDANFQKKIVITGIFRTLKENAQINGLIDSAHLYLRAVDIRSRNFTTEELGQISRFLASTFGALLYVNISNHGTAPHIHINLRYNYLKGIEDA